jgi:SMODS-associating 2TM, beta-strand rich effector domain
MNFKYYKTEKLIFFIIGLTILFGAISTYLHHIIYSLPKFLQDLILFTDSFTVPFFISLIMYFVNTKWWKTKKFKWLIDVPNLNGRYKGKLISSYIENGNAKTMDCVLEIKQSASSIHISGYFGDIETGIISSSSFSVSEELVKERNGFFRLFYIFTNETGGLPDKLNNHSGTAKLLYYPDNYTLDGEYYNKLKNVGMIKVSFEHETLLGRFKP